MPLDITDLWEGMPNWAKATDWNALKVVMQKCYPASTDTQQFTYQEFLRLVCKPSHQEITSVTEWSKYLNKYLAMTHYLVRHTCLSELEQRRYLLESLSNTLHHEVTAHLRLVNPTRDPEEVEEVNKIDEAISYCL